MGAADSASRVETPSERQRPTPEDLVRQHAGLVHGLAHRLCGSADEALDAAQETFLNLIEALPGFRGECALTTWIYRVALNTCRGRGRRRQQLRSREAPLAAEPAAREPSSHQVLEEAERRDQVRQAIDDLPDPYREVVVLHYLQDLGYEEIAAVLEIPLGTVKVRLHRAKERLRRRLEPSDAVGDL
ncbi:MAG: RNA polymerase sigma factor [Gemmatimonadota bacterium]